jgi:hypothetical protein
MTLTNIVNVLKHMLLDEGPSTIKRFTAVFLSYRGKLEFFHCQLIEFAKVEASSEWGTKRSPN